MKNCNVKRHNTYCRTPCVDGKIKIMRRRITPIRAYGLMKTGASSFEKGQGE
jgi:hypothetical protein